MRAFTGMRLWVIRSMSGLDVLGAGIWPVGGAVPEVEMRVAGAGIWMRLTTLSEASHGNDHKERTD